MDFSPPSDLTPFEVLFDVSEPNPCLPEELVQFVGNLGFPDWLEDRPWVFANFAQSLDGLVSFGGEHPGGEWVARSRHDRWMMDLLRTRADAVLLGAHSLVQEATYGKIPGGPVFRIVDPGLLRLRQERFGLGKLINILVTGSGNLKLSDYRLFHSDHVEAWVATTPDGLRNLRDRRKTPVLLTGQGTSVDLHELLRRLTRDHDIRYLLCEGGPTLYGHMVREGLVDEKFVTISPQEIGSRLPAGQQLTAIEEKTGRAARPTSFAGPGFTIETARWYQWISCRKADDHEFNRYRARPRREES